MLDVLSPVKPVHLRFERSFFIRQGIVGGLLGFFCLMIAIFLSHAGWLSKAIPVVFFAPWVYFVVREYRLAAILIDDDGVTRNDGRRFSWSELKAINEAYMRMTSGQPGPLNNVDIVFSTGFARVLPMVLENGWLAVKVLEQRKKQSVPATPPPAADTPTSATSPAVEAPVPASPKPIVGKCRVCGELGDYERGMQTHGREAEDTFLPAAAGRLKCIREVRPGHNRSPVLEQCPECGAYFLYQIVYDYLATGSEDEQILTRLSDEKANEILNGTTQ